MADETTPVAPPIPDSIPIDTDPPVPSIPIDLNPEYDPTKDKRAPFLKTNLNPTGPTISPAPDRSVGQVIKEAATENIPQFSSRTSANPKYGKQSLLPDSDIMTAQQRREAPALAGGLDVASELAAPGTIATVAATAGLGEAGVIPKVLSGLFAGQIAASVYDQYPALKAAVDKAQHAKSKEEHDDAFAEAQQLLTHMGADTVMGLLAAEHGAEGAKEILDKTTGSGVPDQASTFKSPGAAPKAVEPEETHPEMNRDTVKKLQDLGYSNQHITNFNISEIRDILKNETPAAEHPVSKPATAPEPDKFAEAGGKLVSPPAPVSTSAETPAATEAGAADPVEDILMSDKIGGKKVRGATPKVEPTELARRAPEAASRGLIERTTGDEQADAHIKTAGAIPAGNMAGLAMFHDPKTGSTLALKAGDVTPEAVQQHLAASRKAFGLVPEPDAFAEANGKFVGEKPAAAPEQHPTIAALKTKFGSSTDPADMIKGGASFLHSDGTVTNIGATDHPMAIAQATGTRPSSVDRTAFIDETGSIRVRHRPAAKAGPEIVFSVPEQGVTSDQVDMMKQAVGKMGRNGNLLIESTRAGSEPSESVRSWPENDVKEFARPTDVEPMLQKIGAHPDQQDILSKELQTPHKETYGMEVEHTDGQRQTVQIDAHSAKQAMATVQKKFPSVDGYREWSLATMPEETTPSTDYSVPVGKIQKMRASGNRTEIHTIRHELGHAMVGINEGNKLKGVVSSSHPAATKDTRAGVLWDGAGLWERGTDGRLQVKADKRAGVVRQMMGGIAADEVFNDTPRAANHNFPITAGGDGTQAYSILTKAGFTHDQAMEEMHKMIDENVAYLSQPHVSSVIQENENTREQGLSRQYHYSPERLQNMHAETERRKANEKQTDTGVNDNRTTGAGAAEAGRADVAGGEGGVSEADKGVAPEGEEGIVSEDKIKKTKAPQVTSELAQQIVDAHAANGGSTFNLTHGDLAGTDNYAVSTHPDRGQTLDHPPTAEDIQDFAKKNKDLLQNPEKSLGTWHNTADDTHALDVVSTIKDRTKAVALGKKNNQIAIFHLGTNTEIPTGGTGTAPLSPEQKAQARGEKRIAEWKQGPAFVPSTGGTATAPAAPPAPEGHANVPTVSTRTPSITVNKTLVDDHSNHQLTSDMQAAAAAPGFLKKLADRVSSTPGFIDPGGDDHEARTNAYIRHVADNTKFVQSKVTPEEHATDSQWYPVGAHERGIAVAKAHDLSPHQAYAATAALSPLTDWDQNTAQAERAAEIWKNQQDTKFTPQMRKAADEILNVPEMQHFKREFKSLEGKKLGELKNVEDQAWWLRLYEEGHYDRSFQTWNPDGTSGGLAMNTDGVTPKAMSWSFQSLIENAIDIMKDGSHENISRVLGEGHKVRNFYNNQLSPDDPRFLTIDTHQVNIGQLRPMSGSYPSVSDNFGTPSNAPFGLSGTYVLHDAGTRLAAKELGIDIPSRLQSSGWVKIRKQFPNKFKTEENLAVVDAIWKEHTDGKITADAARNKIWDFAERWNSENTGEAGSPSDQRELFDAGVRGETPSGAAGRGDRNDAPSESAKTSIDDDVAFLFGENAPKARSKTSKVSDKQKAKNDEMVKGLAGLINSGKK